MNIVEISTDKQCPFCGCKKNYLSCKSSKYSKTEGFEKHKWYVRCSNCKATGGNATGIVAVKKIGELPSFCTTDKVLKRKAIDKWTVKFNNNKEQQYEL